MGTARKHVTKPCAKYALTRYRNLLQALNKTKQLLVDEGATFENAFVTTPVCCPSRSSIMTGLYLHNTGTFNNSVSGNCASQQWRDGPERKAFATYLKNEVILTTISLVKL